MSTTPTLELFHTVAEAASAKVRRWVVEHELVEAVRFRNVVYPEVQADLQARSGGLQTPALWDGARLFTGAEAVIARLEAHRDVGREG
jgi:hypothetical protein